MTGDSISHARTHYDNSLTDRFYYRVWAGEDLFIGIGIFEQPDDDLQTACCRTIGEIMSRFPAVPDGESLNILDLGGGYGAADRYLVRSLPCDVTVLNLSAAQNADHARRNQEAGLESRIRIVEGDFQAPPADLGPFDVIMSQDSLVHASDRKAIFTAADRMLKDGGSMVFTDLLRGDQATEDGLKPVLARLGLSELASTRTYRDLARETGWEDVEYRDLSPHIGSHYRRLLRTMEERRDSMTDDFTEQELDAIAAGIQTWIDATVRGDLGWGLFHFRKT